MPANRMKAPVADTLKVIGSSSAMVSAGPRPGSTPIAVPTVVPASAHNRLVGVSAVAKPPSSEPNTSTLSPEAQCRERAVEDQKRPGVLEPAADIDAEAAREGDQRDDGDHDRDREVPQDAPAAEGARDEDELQRR